jgi:uncharacterized membrane protein
MGPDYAFGISKSGAPVGQLNSRAFGLGYELETTLISAAYDATNTKAVGVVTQTISSELVQRGRMWTVGGTITRNLLNPASGYENSQAYGINEAENRVVGSSDTDWDDEQATVWTKTGGNWSSITTGTALPYLLTTDTYSVAYEVNEDGLILGSSGSDENNLYAQYACLWEETGPGTYTTYNLNSLVTNLPIGWTLNEARDINASGQIVGTMSYGFGESVVYRSFVLTIPEPATLLLLGIGGFVLRRKH